MRRKRKKAFVITKVKPKLVFVPSKKFWGRKIAGALFLIFGSVILTSTFFYFFIIPVFFQKGCPPITPPLEIMEFPQKVSIPRLDIEIQVEEAKVVDEQWVVLESNLSFLPGNASFEKGGNIIIFGSNKSKVLGKLPLVKKGDQIILFGHEKYLVFEITEAKTVLPTDETIFSETAEKTLILFSTSDYLKGKRFLVKAKKI